MRLDKLESDIEIPAGVSVSYSANGVYVVKGPKGEITRRLFNQHITAAVAGSTLTLTSLEATRREKKLLFTYASHVRNMIKGVQEGFEYKLKICSGHFPMTVAVKGDVFEVKNFIGEAVPRTLKLNPKIKVVVDGVVVNVEGVDLEETSQVAARIESLCKRSGFDRRIFQDGIYITHKDGKAV